MKKTVRFHKQNRSLFMKILAGFVLALLPLYLLSYSLYYMGITQTQEDVLSIEYNQAQYHVATFQKELDHIITVQREFTGNFTLNKLAIAEQIMTPYQVTEAILLLQSDLNLLLQTSPYISRAFIEVPSIGRRISSDQVETLLEFSPQLLSDDTNSTGSPYYLNTNLNDNSYGDLVLSLPFPLYYDVEKLQYIVSIEISRKRIEHMLAGTALLNNGAAGIMKRSGSWLISSGLSKTYMDDVCRQISVGDSLPLTYQWEDGDDQWMVFAFSLPLLDAFYVYLMPQIELLDRLAVYRQRLWILAGLTIGTLVFFSLWIQNSLERPMEILMMALDKISQGDMEYTIPLTRRSEFNWLYERFNSISRNLSRTVKLLSEQENLTNTAELKQLQYQINPHFLYNSIYHMYRMARTDDCEAIERYALHLGNYYHYITRKNGGEVTLKEELSHARHYAEIQKIRFLDRVAVSFETLPEHLSSVNVPALILQPVLENAYQHGLHNCEDEGWLSLTFCEDPELLRIIIEDNGVTGVDNTGIDEIRRKLAQQRSGSLDREDNLTALLNINRRLMLKYPGRGRLDIENKADYRGIRVILTIPVTGEFLNA